MVEPRHPPRHDGRPAVAAHPTPPAAPPHWLPSAAICLGMVTWVLAYTPDPIVLGAVPGIVGWLLLVERTRSLRALIAWTVLFGAVATGIGYRWLAPTVQLFGGVGVVASWLAVVLFGLWNTLHGWVFAYFYRGLLRAPTRPHPLITVVLIVGCEALPIRMFGWMSGHGAIDVPPLLQSAEWGSVVGVSLVLCCLVVPLHEWLRWVFAREGPPARPLAALVTFGIGAALFGWGIVRHAEVRDEERAATKHLRIAIAQANIGSLEKRNATSNGGRWLERSLAAYRRVTEKALADAPDLIVWPETAITDPVPMGRDALTHEYLRTHGYEFLLEAGRKRALLVGLYERVVGRESLSTGERLVSRYNVAALRQPGGRDAAWSLYRKVHLIPFGETMPLGLFEQRLPQDFKMLPGTLPQPLLEFEGLTFAPFLCYEGILPEHVREYVGDRRPDVLASLTNDSWFGDTWEPHQHLNFTRFRAVEHRAPLVRATNTGISAFVSATGDVEARLGVGVEDALVRDVPIVTRQPTLYARFGYRLPWALWAVALIAWLVAQLRAVGAEIRAQERRR